MTSYQQILNNILNNGTYKHPVRFNSDGKPVPVSNATIGTFCEIFRHDMSTGFSLLTTKKMPIKTICVELEGFINGITDKEWYKDRGCNIWNEWANPIEVDKEYIYRLRSCLDLGETPETKNEVAESETDLGPIYGYQWRNFAQHYGEWEFEDYIDGGCCPATGEYQQIDNRNGVDSGFDQLKSIVDKLKENPYDRRMVCSAWNPNQTHLMALPPCHYAFTVVVYGDKLNLCWKQRSVDTFLGLPFNIASYAILLKLLAKESNLKEGELVGVLEDCHIYENHIDQIKEQLTREPYQLPTLNLTHNGSIFDWTHQDIELINYNYHPAIKAEVTV